MTTGLCTYCDRKLDGSKEHVVHSAIGGRLWSKDILCSDTNGEFGSTFDRSFTESLAVFSNLLNITTGRGQAPATLKNVSLPSGERIKLLPGARPAGGKPTVQVEHRDGKTFVRVEADASDADAARRILHEVARKYRPEGASGLKVESRLGQRFYREAVDIPVTLNSPDHRRAVAKIALNLFVHREGSAIGRGDAFARLRDFIVKGTSDDELVWLDYGLRQPVLTGLGTPPPGSHLVVVSANAEDNLVVGTVDVFQLLRFSVILSTSWKGKSFVFGHMVDPVARKSRSLRGSKDEAITLADLKLRGPSNEVYDRRAQALSRYIHERTTEAAISAMNREVIDTVLVGKPGDETLTVTEDHINRMTHLLAAKMTDFVFKTDREFPVNLDSDPRIPRRPTSGRKNRR